MRILSYVGTVFLISCGSTVIVKREAPLVPPVSHGLPFGSSSSGFGNYNAGIDLPGFYDNFQSKGVSNSYGPPRIPASGYGAPTQYLPPVKPAPVYGPPTGPINYPKPINRRPSPSYGVPSKPRPSYGVPRLASFPTSGSGTLHSFSSPIKPTDSYGPPPSGHFPSIPSSNYGAPPPHHHIPSIPPSQYGPPSLPSIPSSGYGVPHINPKRPSVSYGAPPSGGLHGFYPSGQSYDSNGGYVY